MIIHENPEDYALVHYGTKGMKWKNKKGPQQPQPAPGQGGGTVYPGQTLGYYIDPKGRAYTSKVLSVGQKPVPPAVKADFMSKMKQFMNKTLSQIKSAGASTISAGKSFLDRFKSKKAVAAPPAKKAVTGYGNSGYRPLVPGEIIGKGPNRAIVKSVGKKK